MSSSCLPRYQVADRTTRGLADIRRRCEVAFCLHLTVLQPYNRVWIEACAQIRTGPTRCQARQPAKLSGRDPLPRSLGYSFSPLARRSRPHEGWYLCWSYVPALPTTFSRQLQPRPVLLPHVDGLPTSTPTDTNQNLRARETPSPSGIYLKPLRTTLRQLRIPYISTTAYSISSPDSRTAKRPRARPCENPELDLIGTRAWSLSFFVHSAESRSP